MKARLILLVIFSGVFSSPAWSADLSSVASQDDTFVIIAAVVMLISAVTYRLLSPRRSAGSAE